MDLHQHPPPILPLPPFPPLSPPLFHKTHIAKNVWELVACRSQVLVHQISDLPAWINTIDCLIPPTPSLSLSLSLSPCLSENQTKGSDSLPIPPSGQYCTWMLWFFLQPWSVVCPKMSFPWTIQARDKEREKIIPPHQSWHDQECPQHSAAFPSMWLMYTATNSAFASGSSLSLSTSSDHLVHIALY